MTIIVICYVAVDGIAFVATFYKSYFSLILSQLFLRLRVSFLSTLPKSAAFLRLALGRNAAFFIFRFSKQSG